MAPIYPIYADHPFTPIPTPVLANQQNGVPSDMFDQIASQMALVHNMLVLGLNAIYLQAPHIKPADEKGFLNFTRVWYEILHHHHSDEETDFFPVIENMVGEKGIMDANVEQHHAFHEPLHAFQACFEAFAAGKAKYDGNKLVELIDAFGPMLVQHLADEIPTLQGLKQYGEVKMADLPKRFNEQGQKSMKSFGPNGLTVMFSLIDVHYEKDLWTQWPPAPDIVKFVSRNMLWWFYGDTVKFGACDKQGNLKPLYACP